MLINDVININNENKNSRDYFLCALSSIAFGPTIELENVSKSEKGLKDIDKGYELEYWWFCGLVDIVQFNSRCREVLSHTNLKSDYRRDIDLYCTVLANKEIFLELARISNNDRIKLTNVAEAQNYYPFNEEQFEAAFDKCSNLKERISNVVLRYDKLKSQDPDAWTMSLESYPVKRIIGYFIYKSNKNISSEDFTRLLNLSVKVIKNKRGVRGSQSVDVSNDTSYSFITSRFEHIKSESLEKNVSKDSKLGYGYMFSDVLKQNVSFATFRDKETGIMISLDSQRTIGKEFDNDWEVKETKYVDLNKCLGEITEFNEVFNKVNFNEGKVNILSALQPEIDCSALIRSLNSYSKKVYGTDLLRTIEGSIFGTEANKSYDNNTISVKVKVFYDSFKNINSYNILHVFNVVNTLSTMSGGDNLRLSSKAGIYDTNKGLFSSNMSYRNSNSDLSMILVNKLNTIRTGLCERQVYNSRVFWNFYFMYIYDIYDGNYDRAELPKLNASSNNGLYLPIPYKKDETHNTVDILKNLSRGINAFSELKEYCEVNNKDISDLQFYQKSKDLQHLNEKKGGLNNLQNGENEFVSQSKNAKGRKYIAMSLMLAEDMDSDDNFIELVNSIKSRNVSSSNILDEQTDRSRSVFSNQVDALKISESELISITDIFCDRPNRNSAKIQGYVWKRCNALKLINFTSKLKDLNSTRNICENDLLTFDLFDGMFMRYNGDVSGGYKPTSLTYYHNFSDMISISQSDGGVEKASNSTIIESSRLLGFSFLKAEDFLQVEEVYRKFILPCLINIDLNTELKSLVKRGNLNRKSNSVKMSKYIKVGAKIGLLILESKARKDKNFDLSFLINEADLKGIYNSCLGKFKDKFSGVFKHLDGLPSNISEVNVIKSAVLRLKQLRLMILKSMQYCEDLVELCLTFNNLFYELKLTDSDEGLGALSNVVDLFCESDGKFEGTLIEKLDKGSIISYWFYNEFYEDLVNLLFSKFEEFGGNESELFSHIENNINTDLAVNGDDELSWFYACSYLCHVTSRNYSILCDIAHDAYILSNNTTVDNNSGRISEVISGRCCYYYCSRSCLIDKLISNFSSLKISAKQNKLKIKDLHKLADFPEDSLSIVVEYGEEIGSEVVTKFNYMFNQVGKVKGFKEYRDKIFGSNIARIQERGFPNFNKVETNFELNSEVISKIEEKVNSVNVGKFNNNTISILKNAVKNTGLYRVLNFDNSNIGKMKVGNHLENFVMYGYGSNGISRSRELVYLVHKEGFFIEVDLMTNDVRILDTVRGIILDGGIDYGSSSAMSNDINADNKVVFDSLRVKNGKSSIGLSTKTERGKKIKKAIMDNIIDVSRAISDIRSTGLEVNSQVLSIAGSAGNESTELSVVNSDTELVRLSEDEIRLVNSKSSEIKSKKNMISNALSVIHTDSKDDNMVSILKAACDGQCNEYAISRLLDKAVLDGTNVEQFPYINFDDCSETEKNSILVEEKWNRLYLELSEVIGVNMDIERQVTDFEEMYSSVVPNTVRR